MRYPHIQYTVIGEEPEGVVIAVDDAPQAAAAAEVGECGQAGDVRSDEAQRRAPGRERRRDAAARDETEVIVHILYIAERLAFRLPLSYPPPSHHHA